MKIRMIATIDERYVAGQELDVSEPTAARWIERGYAVPVRAQTVETTTAPAAPEIAMKRVPRRKRKGKRHVERS